MSIQVHHSDEIGKTARVVLAAVAFVVIMLTWVPELIAPAGGPGASDVGKTIRLLP